MPIADIGAGYDRDLMRSCIYGLAVGDALGVPYEFRERGDFTCTGMDDGGSGRCARGCVLRLRGDPAGVGRQITWEGCNRAMRVDSESNIKARAEIAKARCL